jgi:uncharacterized protein YndB with AHSA1/START domain
MFDRQTLESILRNRFPGVPAGQVAAAANAIMSLREGDAAFEGVGAVVDTSRAGAEPSTQTTVRVISTIDAPLDRVFDLFADVEHAADYVTSIQSITMLTPDRPFGLGARWRETREVFGALDSAEMEVTAFEPERAYTITHQKAGVRIETTFAFEPADGDATTVSIEFAVQSAGLPGGILTPLSWAIAGKVRHVLNRDLSDLKKAAEAR